ncbi:FHIP family protein GJ17503 isoform X2 [Episyrphus balteatus]|uniref:FHIP family protein GJ17503 isoform X2 n=1 Tax=Episyrphus balteatus TaxID=286459 RepID=UPI002486721A|nr:FHIP family protein GJ17503 isoform X2 [Episyrphus balteatus]
MSWLRSSPLRQSLTRNGSSSSATTATASISSGGNGGNNSLSTTSLSSLNKQRPIDTATDCDPRACYDSFCKHWQQAYEIIQRADNQKAPTHDDVLGVVSHLDYMVTLLLVELHHCNKISLPSANSNPPAPCLEFLLSENLLDKLYEWGIITGRYSNAVRLEQLKLYELLVSHSRHQLLCHEPFLRPLLKILDSSQGEIFPPDLEKRLVILLNQLCVVLMQNVHLLDLFFFSSEQHKQGQYSTNFIIFSLLIPYVHREGSLGHQARDALLLCMALSQKNSNIGTYIAQYSSMCPLLVTGLGGLYSRLPNSIEINTSDWHRITPDDVTEIPELTLFMNALEFCNAVVQVAHDLIKNQLLDFMYQGFIVPVLGPAILQTNVESQISAMSYLDLILRSVTEPGLLRAFVKFLLDEEKFDGQRIIDTLIERLSASDSNLCMVAMSLFETLLSLHCEDIMLELLLKYLLPGKHVPISYRHKINKIDPYTNTSDFFLDLTPEVMKRARELKHKPSSMEGTSTNDSPSRQSMSKTIGANWNYYGLHTGDTLYSNYHAYLFDAHYKIAQSRAACNRWANTYKYQKWPPRQKANGQTIERINEMVRNFFSEFSCSPLQYIGDASNALLDSDKNKYDSLQSIGESSGYESFKWRPDDDHDSGEVVAVALEVDADSGTKVKATWRLTSRRDLVITDLDFSEDLFAQGTVTLGPFLNAVWGKLQTFTSNTLYVNLHLTGLITRLALYPLPLTQSVLLRPDIVTTSDTPSFHQVLRILKQQIDAELPVTEDSLEIIDVARSYLIDREFRLINARKVVSDSGMKNGQRNSLQPTSTFANISSSSPVQVTPSSSYDPFRRADNKRKSFTTSISNMFGRKPNASSGLSQIYAFFTGSTFSNAAQSLSSSTHSLASQSQSNSISSNQMNSIPLRESTPTSGSTTPNTGGSNNNSNATISNSLIPSTIGGNNMEPASLDSISSMSSTMGAIANSSGTERTRDLSLCAVLLDEWLKELSAISQEQSIVMISDTNL